MSNCKILSGLNGDKILKDKLYDYIFIDLYSMTIVPYLNSEKYQSTDNINITPFIESFRLYVSFKRHFPDAKFIFVADGGISPKILKLLPTYKENRKSNKYRKNSISERSGKISDYNVYLFKELMDLFGEVTITDINRNEADFVIGYMANKCSLNHKCLIISHDKDMLLGFDKNSNVDVIYKQTGEKNRKVTIYFVDSIECVCNLYNIQYLRSSKELLFYKALIGDKSDGIPKPFGIKSKKIVANMFENAFMYEIDINYQYIIEYFTKKFDKMNPAVIERFTSDFRRNIAIMNIYNDEILSDSEKIILNTICESLLENYHNSQINRINRINEIYELFDKYGLYLKKEDLEKTFKFLKIQ